MSLFKPAWLSKNPKKVLASFRKDFKDGYGKVGYGYTIPLDVARQVAQKITDETVCIELFTNLAESKIKSKRPPITIDDCIEVAELCPGAYTQLAYASILRALCKESFITPALRNKQYSHYCDIMRIYDKVTDESVKAEARRSYLLECPPDKARYESGIHSQQQIDDNRGRNENRTKEQMERDQLAYTKYRQDIDREYYE